MSVTLKEIAAATGVSVATASYALSRNRYVSPELRERVEAYAAAHGYQGRSGGQAPPLRAGKGSRLVLIAPDSFLLGRAALTCELGRQAAEEGFLLSVCPAGEDPAREKLLLAEAAADRRTAGVIAAPLGRDPKPLGRLRQAGMPLVCLERVPDGAGIAAVAPDCAGAVDEGTALLIRKGHERIALLLDREHFSAREALLRGYQAAMGRFHIPWDSALVLPLDPRAGEEACVERIRGLLAGGEPTALVAGSGPLTRLALEALGRQGLECPRDISLVGWDDEGWGGVLRPALTALCRDDRSLAAAVLEQLARQREAGEDAGRLTCVPMRLEVRDSARWIARGPLGERTVYPEENLLSEAEERALRAGDYTVALSFHYTGSAWTRLHEKAIKETLQPLGVRVLAVADAHFDPALQITQLEGLVMQKPDAIIAIPTDEGRTAAKFREIAKKTKLILLNSIPVGMERSDYWGWVSVNEWENGRNMARLLGEHFAGARAPVALLIHGRPFLATRQRDFAAEQVLREHYPGLPIAAAEPFETVQGAYGACRRLLLAHPEIQGLYVTWDQPALEALRAMEELGREDIAVATSDLDYEIAARLRRGGQVIGISSQRPYEQGQAVAIATAKALLGHVEHRCVGVSPYLVDSQNLERAWREILRSSPPDFTRAMG